LVEQIRKTERAKEIYAQRKETIERVFADAKEKHAMTPPRLGRRHTMGQTKIRCHEPEKAGKLELGALLFRLLFLSVSPIFEENPCSRFLKAWVL